MAAPRTAERGTPAGIKLDDGYSTKVACYDDTDISFWERSVTPPGLDGDEPINTTTMFNVTYRTFSPRALKTLTPFTMSAAYDPDIYDQALALINKNKEWTVTFPDGSTLDFWGFLQKFEPGELVEGTFPEATITVVPTNQDNDGAEQAAVMTEVAGC